MQNEDILKYAVDNGIVDLEYVQQQIDMKRRKDVIDCHPYKIWQGTDGSWYTYFPKKPKGRKQVKRKSKDELYNLIYDFYEENNEISLKNMMQRWINDKLYYGEIAKQTYQRYTSDIERFFVGSKLYKTDISQIKAYELEDFIKLTIIDKNLTAKAYGGLRLLIKGVFKYAHKRGYTDIVISTFFEDMDLSSKIFTKPDKKEEVFTDIEVKKIEDWIWKHDESLTNLSILLGFYTGMRVGEIVALKHDDIDLVNCTIKVNKTEIRYKNDDDKYVLEVRNDAKTEAGNRIVFFNNKAIKVFKRMFELNPDGEYLILGDKGRVPEQNVTHKLYYICDQIGISPKSMHKTRKTYCTKMLNAKVGDAFITSQMGHTNITTSKDYYYRNNYDSEQAKEKVDSALGM